MLSRFKESGALIHWAWKQGLGGIDYRATRDSAGDIGTLIHFMAESVVLGTPRPVDVSEVSETDFEIAQKAEGNFIDWWQDVDGVAVASEAPLVSEAYQFGGTPDLIGRINHELCVVDYKTSKGVYADHIAQVAAYRQLWNESNPHNKCGVGAWIVRLDKKTGEVVPRHFPDITPGWDAFVSLRHAYDYMADLERMVKAPSKARARRTKP